MTVTRKTNGEEYYGVSTDTKPRESQVNSIFHELDTGKDYYNTCGSAFFYENTITTKNGVYPNTPAAGWISEPHECRPITDTSTLFDVYIDDERVYHGVCGAVTIDATAVKFFGDPTVLMGQGNTFCFIITDYDQTVVFATPDPATHHVKILVDNPNQWREIGS